MREILPILSKNQSLNNLASLYKVIGEYSKALGVAFIQWANYIEWELNSKKETERDKNAKNDKTKPF